MKSDAHKTVFAPVMSTRDWAAWGLPDIAYIRQAPEEGEGMWTIHAADGSRIGKASSRDLAFAAVRQNDLEPMSVH